MPFFSLNCTGMSAPLAMPVPLGPRKRAQLSALAAGAAVNSQAASRHRGKTVVLLDMVGFLNRGGVFVFRFIVSRSGAEARNDKSKDKQSLNRRVIRRVQENRIHFLHEDAVLLRLVP